MKTRKQILVAVFLAIAFSTSYAQAGLLDWFVGSDTKADQASSQSFDQLYASVTSSPVQDQPAMTANAFIGVSTPAGKAAQVLRKTYFVEVSAYNSEVGQTDSTPDIGACGRVHDGIIAANVIGSDGRFLPCGTIVKIPSVFGDKIFVVGDRLNKRYTNNIDIWMESHADAVKFGRRHLAVEVIQ